MRILVVGGTGALGAHAACYLDAKGHEITIASRNPPLEKTRMASFPFLHGDYVKGDFTSDRLRGFDAVVFAAGNDMRHISFSKNAEQLLLRANAEGIPSFARAARKAGVKRMVQIGSAYPQSTPDLVQDSVYLRSRLLACEGARAEGRAGFDVISVNPSFMVGGLPGMPSYMLDPYGEWATGMIEAPFFAPTGGSNFMSYSSLSQAIEGALLRGEPGKAYLVGDETLSFADYLNLFFEAVGNPVRLEARDEAHPVFPDEMMVQGRGNWILYEPDADEAALLGYKRNDVANGVAEAVAAFRTTHVKAG
ncbi:nucleoside-diphosphate sugar epimerase [Rhodococcus pyridinivorans KG-16]|uniref:Nucleoside-diphosphate sugar epimerase n=1 Tax=Rhodococcus pyridinivorans KG-16 TaxID=1441730 RepID=A0A0V9UD87_9NOCA|nr:NAD-dependent epimerase/dehydratase family protein [Rhodococcus pyridinivorans]KSZ56080.1 nucleoside-diphosphate sugar epimerase [Rhodococcus pyridinivorans KG-16]